MNFWARIALLALWLLVGPSLTGWADTTTSHFKVKGDTAVVSFQATDPQEPCLENFVSVVASDLMEKVSPEGGPTSTVQTMLIVGHVDVCLGISLFSGQGETSEHAFQFSLSSATLTTTVPDNECKREYFGLESKIILYDDKEITEWKMKNYGGDSVKRWFRSSFYENLSQNISGKLERNRLYYDYAMIVKAPNPINLESGVILICGIHGIGTLAGALYPHRRTQELLHNFPHTAQAHLIEVRYTIENEGDKYVDSEILTIRSVGYKPLWDK